MSSQGGRVGGQKFPILLSKKTTKRGGGGQKFPILRRHSLWTEPYGTYDQRLSKHKFDSNSDTGQFPLLALLS